MTDSVVLRPQVAPVALDQLLPGAPQVSVTGISLSSRSVLPGDLYVALPGASTHGARHVAAALQAGAVAVLTDAAGARSVGLGIPMVVADDPRLVLAGLAAGIYGHPADHLHLYAITGTTGKTSTSFLLAAGLAAAGIRVGTIGTIGFALDGKTLPSGRTTVTTPESPDLQGLLGYLVEHGADSVAMEVSSHALVLGRVDGLVFDVSAFTNLGRDHLDFHPDQEAYFQAKATLFQDGRSRSAVVNIDTQFGERLAQQLRATGLPILTTGSGPQADYHPLGSEQIASGRRHVHLRTPGGDRDFELSLLGEFNIHNATTAIAMLELAGIDLEKALPGIAAAQIPGRMQRVELGPDAPAVVVDFAHTPESVEAALASLPKSRKIVVLGCGGDRDQTKREPMGQAAAAGADVVVVTDDNPRSEDPRRIRQQVLVGARRAASSSGAEVIDGGDRAAAIRTALALAHPGDWVAVLGKGHETGQEIAGERFEFDDVVVVARQWMELKESGHA